MANSRMGEEENYGNQKLEDVIKEVGKNVGVTLTTEDGNKNHSVQGHWQGLGQGRRDGTGWRTVRPRTGSTPG